MSLKVGQRQITTPQGVADTPPAPIWVGDLPMCATACPHLNAADDSCLLQEESELEPLCLPAVEAMARLLNEDET